MLLIQFKLALRNLLRNRNRTAIAVLTVGGGIVAFLLASGFINWIFHDMREATIRSQLGHIQIVRPGFFDTGIADPYQHLLPAQSSDEESVRKIAGLKTLTPRLIFSGLASLNDTTVAFSGEGINPEDEKEISSRISISQGRNIERLGEASAILGEGLAANLGTKPGDTLVLLGTSATGGPSAVEITVVGTFFTINKEFDNYALRVPLPIARKLIKVDGATSWVALLNKTADTETTTHQIKQHLDPGKYQIVPWYELADFYNKTVVLFGKQVDVVKMIIAIIIILTISNTQMMNVMERTTEIGTALAIGVRQSEILTLFLVEGILIGLAGGILGTIAAYLLGMLISSIGIPMPPPPGMARGYMGQIMINMSLSKDALLLAFATTLLASVVPAWKASRMKIVDALRCNQ